MTLPLIIIGAGGFGREAADVIYAQNAASTTPVYDLLGIIDSHPSKVNLERLNRLGIPYLGDESSWLSQKQRAHYLVGVGNPEVRRVISKRFEAAGYVPGLAVHPTATLGSDGRFGLGSVVCAGAQVSSNVSVGRHVHINPGAIVGHDSVLEDFVSLNPGCVVSGDVVCETGVLVGAGAVILQGLRVGERSLVGAASCVTRDVPADRTVKGVPAR